MIFAETGANAAGLSVVPQLLKSLGQKYPDIEVALREMGTAAQRTGLRQGEIDVAFIYALPDREFAHHQLTPESLVRALLIAEATRHLESHKSAGKVSRPVGSELLPALLV